VNIDLVMLVLEFSEVFEVYISGIKYLLALRVNEYDLLVLLQLLASLNVFLAVFFTHVYGLDFRLSLFYLFDHHCPLFLGRKRGQRLMKQRLGLVRKS